MGLRINALQLTEQHIRDKYFNNTQQEMSRKGIIEKEGKGEKRGNTLIWSGHIKSHFLKARVWKGSIMWGSGFLSNFYLFPKLFLLPLQYMYYMCNWVWELWERKLEILIYSASSERKSRECVWECDADLFYFFAEPLYLWFVKCLHTMIILF